MFESEYNLLFNLNKAYVDIGIDYTDAARTGAIYGIEPERVAEIFAEDYEFNAAAAKRLIAGNPTSFTDRPIRVAYLGDSITTYRRSHRAIIECATADKPNIDYKDYSIAGYKVSDIYTAFFPYISDYAPDVAVIMIGTNDMRITNDRYKYCHTPIEEYKRDIDYILENLADIGCKAVITTLPPFDMAKMDAELDGWKILYTDETREQYDAVVASSAKAYGAELVDMRGVYAGYDAGDITLEDGLHLNPKGQYILAEQIAKKLFPLLADNQ